MIGGYRACLANPNAGGVAKQNARRMIDALTTLSGPDLRQFFDIRTAKAFTEQETADMRLNRVSPRVQFLGLLRAKANIVLSCRSSAATRQSSPIAALVSRTLTVAKGVDVLTFRSALRHQPKLPKSTLVASSASMASKATKQAVQIDFFSVPEPSSCVVAVGLTVFFGKYANSL